MNEWMERSLSEIAIINPRETIQKGQIARKVAMEMLQPFTKKVQGYSWGEYQGGTKFKNGDVLVARITPCLENGKTAFVDFLDDDEIGFGSTEFIILREKENFSNNHFLYYLARSPSFRDIAVLSMTGSSGRQRVQVDVLADYLFDIPPLDEQQAIAGILSSLDDKIDLLHRQNQTLEALAQTLFRHWFIDGAVVDWEECVITDLFEIRDGTHDSPKQSEFGRPLITSRHIKDFRLDFANAYLISEEDFIQVNQRSKVEQFDILFSMIGTIGLIYLEQSETVEYAIKNVGLFKTSQNPNWAFFTYLWLKSSYGKEFIFEARSGSTQQYISLGSLRNIVYLRPPDVTLSDFNDSIKPLFSKIRVNQNQIYTLEKIRDTLLPKLMSGEVRVLFSAPE